ncbi:MAG: DUF4340 domain-containing protein [Myxococcales bacterium]|nr:DUF4340 domain-containing protein [Myxococcales bacterium]
MAVIVLDWQRVADEPTDLDAPPSRDLFAFQSEAISRVSLKRATDELVFEREEGQWKMTSPVVALAKGSAIEAIIDRLAEVRIEDAVLTGPDADYGLDESNRTELRLEKDDGTAFTVYVGKDTPVGYKSFAQVPGDPDTHLLDNQLASLVSKGPDEFRSKDVLAFTPGSVDRIRIVAGAVETVLRKDDTGWWLGDTGPRADGKRVADWMSAVSLLKADRFLDGQEPGALGLDNPALLVAVNDAGGTHTLRIGPPDGDGANAAAADVAFRIAAADLDKLNPTEPWASARLVDTQSWKVDRIVVKLGDQSVEAARKDGSWQKPDGTAVDTADSLIEALLELAVDRSGSATMAGSWGRIELGLGAEKLVVAIGDASVDGARVAKEEAGGPAFSIPAASLIILGDGVAGKLPDKAQQTPDFGGMEGLEGLGMGGSPEEILKRLQGHQ